MASAAGAAMPAQFALTNDKANTTTTLTSAPSSDRAPRKTCSPNYAAWTTRRRLTSIPAMSAASSGHSKSRPPQACHSPTGDLAGVATHDVELIEYFFAQTFSRNALAHGASGRMAPRPTSRP